MRITAQLPPGVAALFGREVEARRGLEETLAVELRGLGYEEVALPIVDYFDPYREVLGASAVRELYRLVDREGELLALRSDFTPLLARLLAPRVHACELPLRLYYRGDVVRGRRGGRDEGARELYQLGAELLGAPGEAGDGEALRVFAALLRRASPRPGRLVMGLAGALDRLFLQCGDASEAARLAAAVARRERRAAGVGGVLREVIVRGFPARPEALGSEDGERLRWLLARRDELAAELPGWTLIVDLADFAQQARDPELRRAIGDRAYYDGLVFRAYAGDGAEAIASGGRYDELFARLGAPVSAVGFTIDLDRCTALAGVEKGEPLPEARAIRVALPKSRNLPAARRALAAGGLPLAGFEADSRLLWQRFPDEGVEVLLVKDWDLPLYVERGIADLGFVGSDVLGEVDGDLLLPLRLPWGRSRMSLIGPAARQEAPRPGAQLRLATKYPRAAARLLRRAPWGAELLPLSGSVELAPLLGLSEYALDIVQTGATLRAHDLAEVEEIEAVAPCVVVNRGSFHRHRAFFDRLLARMEEGATDAPTPRSAVQQESVR